MKTTLVMVAPDEDGDFSQYGYVPRGYPALTDRLNPVIIERPDPQRGGFYAKIEAWMVADEDVPHAVDYLTKNFPGRDIQVLKIQAIFSRTPGELKEKSVSKNGVLPA